MNNSGRVQEIAMRNELADINLREKQVQDLLSFLQALTDPSFLDMRHTVPSRVPSGLSLAE